MKQKRRESLIKMFETTLVILSIADIFPLAIGGRLSNESVRLRILHELCLDELRKDKPDETMIKSFMKKIRSLNEDKPIKQEFAKGGIVPVNKYENMPVNELMIIVKEVNLEMKKRELNVFKTTHTKYE